MGGNPQADDLVFIGKRRGSGMDPMWLNYQFKAIAVKLARHGEIESRNPASWHSHQLRHSFKTEGEHAKIPSGIIEFMMGHAGGVAWVYDNRDQVHPDDISEAYKKLEPHISLDYTEATKRAVRGQGENAPC